MNDIERIHRYEILDKLGEGGFGVVYHAFDTNIKRHVALKLLKLDLVEDKKEREHLKEILYSEARIAGKLSHPNIATIYDISETEDGIPYITMEFVEGYRVSDIISAGPGVPFTKFLKIIHKLAAALHYAHQCGVIHRDLKPSNIMITLDYEPKILDFGFAKWEFQVSSRFAVKGTPAYMAPEQIFKQKISPQTDLFSLGIILWEFVTGLHPFAEKTVDGIIQRIVYDEPGPVAKEILEYLKIREQEWVSYFKKVLHKKPEHRYTNAVEMIRSFEQLLLFSPSIHELTFPASLEVYKDDVITDLESWEDRQEPEDITYPKHEQQPQESPLSHALTPYLPRESKSVFWVLPFIGALFLGILLGLFLSFRKGTELPIKPDDIDVSVWKYFLTTTLPVEQTGKPSPGEGKEEMYRVFIHADPGTEVYLDGQYLGTTPMTIHEFQPGLHRLRLKGGDVRPYETWVFFDERTREYRFRYRREQPLKGMYKGYIYVTSEPEGARLFLNGEEKGTTPLELELRPGRYLLLLTREGYESVERAIEVERGGYALIRFSLNPLSFMDESIREGDE